MILDQTLRRRGMRFRDIEGIKTARFRVQFGGIRMKTEQRGGIGKHMFGKYDGHLAVVMIGIIALLNFLQEAIEQVVVGMPMRLR